MNSSGDGKKGDGSRKNAERRYGKPAGQSTDRGGSFSKPAAGRPAGKPGDKAASFGKPAGRPAGRTGGFGKPASGRPVGRPTGRPGGFSKPNAPEGQAQSEQTTERRFGKPASARPAGRPADRTNRFDKPGSFGKPAGRPAGRTGGFGKPASGRPVGRPGGFSKPNTPGGNSRGNIRPPARPVVPTETTGLSIGARRAALEVLRDVHQNGAFAQLALNAKLSETPLNPADKRLVTSIVYSTLENQIKIDYALDSLMDHPTNEPLQRDILRLSACQILFHDRVPDSAAVNEGVNLAKGMGMESSAGFLNAVLRNLSRGKDTLEWPKKEDDLRRYLHIMGSMPEWIVDKLIEAYGEEEAEKIIFHRETDHHVVIRPNLMKITDEGLEALLTQKGWTFRKGLAPHAYLVSGAESLGTDSDYRDGLFSIQGQSSMLAAEAVQAKPGMRIVDACAAPGGKSAYLCEKMQNTGRVFAWELHEKRAMLLESMKRRLNLESLRVSVRDAGELREDLVGTVDAVLLDAPCSGLGVMAQKPDLKYRLKPEDIDPIVAQQHRLLNAVCTYVKPGGLLVYSTCSILPQENFWQIGAFLSSHPEYTVEALPDSFPESLREQQKDLGLQLLGYRDDVEGFYIVCLRKAED